MEVWMIVLLIALYVILIFAIGYVLEAKTEPMDDIETIWIIVGAILWPVTVLIFLGIRFGKYLNKKIK